MNNGIGASGTRRRIALILLACALLLRLPAGLMPEANAQGVSIGWCNAVSGEAMAEGKALFEKALVGKSAPNQKHTPDQPCPFAAAAQPIAAADPAPLIAPLAVKPLAPPTPFATAPGRGLVAPPPFATGPPLRA